MIDLFFLHRIALEANGVRQPDNWHEPDVAVRVQHRETGVGQVVGSWAMLGIGETDGMSLQHAGGATPMIAACTAM